MSPALLAVALLGGGVVVLPLLGYGLSWLLLHNVDRDVPPADEDRATATAEETLERTERFARWADANPFVAAHPAPVLRCVRRGGR